MEELHILRGFWIKPFGSSSTNVASLPPPLFLKNNYDSTVFCLPFIFYVGRMLRTFDLYHEDLHSVPNSHPIIGFCLGLKLAMPDHDVL